LAGSGVPPSRRSSRLSASRSAVCERFMIVASSRTSRSPTFSASSIM